MNKKFFKRCTFLGAAAAALSLLVHVVLFQNNCIHGSQETNKFSKEKQTVNFSDLPKHRNSLQIVYASSLDRKQKDDEVGLLFRNALNIYSDANKTITISLIDSSYLDMAVNLYKCYKRLSITNYIFVSSDNAACETLNSIEANINCIQYIHNEESHIPSHFLSKAFALKTRQKTKIMMDAVKLGFNALLVDLDIVLFKRPFQYFDFCLQCDLIVQYDRSIVCSGFYLVRFTPAGIKLLELAWKLTQSLDDNSKLNDQHILNKAIQLMPEQDKKFQYKVLSEDLFPNGFSYFHDRQIMFASDGPYPPDVYLVHNNWIASIEAKIYRAKESLMWFYDKDGYYSNGKAKYLLYNNPIDSSHKSDIRNLELKALKAAFIIGFILNRIVILPAFSCDGCNSKKYGACRSKKCSLHTHYSMHIFDKYFQGRYREHSFLSNELVPDIIKHSFSATIVLNLHFYEENNLLEFIDETKYIQYKPLNRTEGASDVEILKWLSRYEDLAVLKFHSLYNAIQQLPNEAKYDHITEKLSHGIKPSDYRQLKKL